MRKAIPRAAAIAAAVLAAAVSILSPAPAGAIEIDRTGFEDVPADTVCIDYPLDISAAEFSATDPAYKVSKESVWVSGTDAVVYDKAVTGSIPGSCTLTWRGAGADADGDDIDLSLTISNGYTPNSPSKVIFLDDYGGLDLDAMAGGGQSIALRMDVTIEVTKSGTSEPAAGTMLIAFRDIDRARSSGYSEQVTLLSGFGDTAWVPETNFLDIDPETGRFTATRVDEITYDSGFVTTGSTSGCTLRWQGYVCGTYVLEPFMVDTQQITASAGSHGSITDPGSTLVRWKNDKTYTFTPDEGYSVSNVVVDGVSMGPIPSYTFESVTGSHEISVEFALSEYVVSFVDGSGGVISTQTVAHGSAATAPGDPERYGYDFVGWDADFSSVTSDMTVTATWDPHAYSIAFDAAGGEGSMDPIEATFGVEGALPACSFTRPGYTFQGWAFEDEEAVGFADGASYIDLTGEDGATVTLRAVWDEDAPVRISYETSLPEHSAVSIGYEDVAPATGTARGSTVTVDEGYRLVCWRDSQGDEVSTDAAFAPSREGAVWLPETYTAVVEPISYTVAFEGGGGEGSMDPMTMDFGDAAALPACSFTRPGYTFQGWAAEAGGGVAYVDREVVGDLATADGDVVTLHAVWAEDPAVTISYAVSDPASGDVSVAAEHVAPATGEAHGSVAEPAAGWRFSHWTDASGSVLSRDPSFVPERPSDGLWRDASYTAVMAPVSYTIAFDAAGGEGSMDPLAMDFDEVVELPACAFTREGHAFAGWSLEPGGPVAYGDRAEVEGLATEDGAVVTLYAVWDPVPGSADGDPFSAVAGAIYDKTGIDPASLATGASLAGAGALSSVAYGLRQIRKTMRGESDDE